MFTSYRYKVVDIPAEDAENAITSTVKKMKAEPGDSPDETKLIGRGGGTYGYIYPLRLPEIRIITEEYGIEIGKIGALLKHKPKNESILHPFTAVDVSTRVSGRIVCELDSDMGEDLIHRIKS